MPDGLQARCRNCHCETSLAWKTSEAGKAAGRKYANSERGREMGRLRRQAKAKAGNVVMRASGHAHAGYNE
jgi:hypothetical protein